MYQTLTADDNPEDLAAMEGLLAKLDPNGRHLFARDGDQALALARDYPPDVAFLDVNMPGMNGLELGQRLQRMQDNINLVFVTASPVHAAAAFDLYASGYLLKPVTEEKLRSALAHLRHAPRQRVRKLRVKCFGAFSVTCDGVPVRFKRSNTMMLLAYLIDQKGELCDKQQIISALWPEAEDSLTFGNQFRVFLSDLRTTLNRQGMGDVLVRSNGLVGINTALVDCDYYHYLEGDPEAVASFDGEYMRQYSFAEVTLAQLYRNWSPKGQD